MNLMFRFQRCNTVVNRTLEINLELNSMAILEQRCNSFSMVRTSLQRDVMVVQRCNLIIMLSQRCLFAGMLVSMSRLVSWWTMF